MKNKLSRANEPQDDSKLNAHREEEHIQGLLNTYLEKIEDLAQENEKLKKGNAFQSSQNVLGK